MPWKQMRVVEERFKFVLAAEAGEKPFRVVCEDFGISRQTGYKWVRRYQETPDPNILEDRPRRPLWPAQETPPEIAHEARAARKRFPFWGPRKLRAWLAKEHPRVRWPAPSTIGRILKNAGLVKPPKRRRRTPPYSKPFSTVTAANQLWCVDFKGHFRTRDGEKVYPLTITDAFSRYLLRCEGLKIPDTASVREVFESAFREFGLPEAIRSDNGAPFASTGLGGLTELSAWWTRIDIRHERIEPGKPQQNGRHERMHLTLKREACQPPGQNSYGQQCKFDRFRKQFNGDRPHEAISNHVPADLYVPSARIYTRDLKRSLYGWTVERVLVSKTGNVKWMGRTYRLSKSLRGDLVDVRRLTKRRWCFSYGPVVLGYLDERRKAAGIIRPKRATRVSTMFPV